MNGQTMIILGKTFAPGAKFQIANKQFEVYNTMPGLSLVGFCRISRNGRLLEKKSMSIEQIETLVKLNVIR